MGGKDLCKEPVRHPFDDGGRSREAKTWMSVSFFVLYSGFADHSAVMRPETSVKPQVAIGHE